MRRTIAVTVLLELVWIGALAALAAVVSLGSSFTSAKFRSDSAVITLKDGSRVEAHTAEDVAELRRRYAGQIKSGTQSIALESSGDRIVVFVVLLLGGLTAYVIVRNWRDLPRWLAPGVRPVLYGVAGGAALLLLGYLYEVSAKAFGVALPDSTIWSKLRAESPLLLALGAVVLAPVGEELYFRGRFFDAVHSSYGVAPAIAVTAVIFALLHGLSVLLPAYVILGVGLALLRVRSGGLVAPMIAHAINNGVVLFVLGE
jgi:membrane protease YdiL (CAAX protease family)